MKYPLPEKAVNFLANSKEFSSISSLTTALDVPLTRVGSSCIKGARFMDIDFVCEWLPALEEALKDNGWLKGGSFEPVSNKFVSYKHYSSYMLNIILLKSVQELNDFLDAQSICEDRELTIKGTRIGVFEYMRGEKRAPDLEWFSKVLSGETKKPPKNLTKRWYDF